MKDKLLYLILGILIGAVITAGIFLVFSKNSRPDMDRQRPDMDRQRPDMEQMEDMKRPEDENIVPQDRVEETNITETNSIAE